MKDPEDERRPGNGEDATATAEQQESGLVAVEPAAAPADLEALKSERDELREQLLRRRADFENFRKRVDRDRQQATLDAEAALIKRMIPTLDNLERALQAGGDEASLREGVELTLRELVAVLEAAGVSAQDPAGQLFDPRTQQALAHEAAPGHADGVVVEVFRKGYFFKDRLVRPALVKVAKPADPGNEAEPDPGSEAVH